MSRGVLAVAVLLLAGCGAEEPAAAPAPPPEVEVPAPLAPAPPPELEVQAPTPTTGGADLVAGDAARGAELYGQFCWTCHGAEGRGDGPTSAALSPKPADHTDPRYMESLSDAHLYRVIAEGGVAVGKSPLMTAWGAVLDDQAIRDLVAHLRALSGS